VRRAIEVERFHRASSCAPRCLIPTFPSCAKRWKRIHAFAPRDCIRCCAIAATEEASSNCGAWWRVCALSRKRRFCACRSSPASRRKWTGRTSLGHDRPRKTDSVLLRDDVVLVAALYLEFFFDQTMESFLRAM